NWEETLSRLSEHKSRLVRSEQRVEVERRLAEDEEYGLWVWFNDILLNRFPRHSRVLVPVNIQYLDVGRRSSTTERDVAAVLERFPPALIYALAAHPVAAETLIRLGDAYLSHLGRNLDNASELAITCYEAALKVLDNDVSTPRFLPVAWATALIGKGAA